MLEKNKETAKNMFWIGDDEEEKYDHIDYYSTIFEDSIRTIAEKNECKEENMDPSRMADGKDLPNDPRM